MKKNKHTLLLGAHVSISGGLEKAIHRGMELGCSCIQIFVKNNRRWFAKQLTKQEIQTFKNTKKASSIKIVIAHAGYLINIGSESSEIETKSISSLEEELQRCIQLDIPYYVLHPGSCANLDKKKCITKIAKNLDIILKKYPGKTEILLETTAGQGSNLGYKFEQIAEIIEKSSFSKRIAVCLDTCHIFAAGYDLRTEKTYRETFEKFDEALGLENLKCFHINDSLKNLNSRIDRHEHIGKGKIGLEGFKLLFNDKRFFDIPKILETPKKNGIYNYLEDIKIIKELCNRKDLKS